MKSKEIRKQLRNISQAEVKEYLTTELVQTLEERLRQYTNKKLETLSSHVNQVLDLQNKRSKEIQGFLINNIVKLNTVLQNMEVTLEAFQSAVAEKLKDSLGSPEEFNKLVDEKKLEIAKRLTEKSRQAEPTAEEKSESAEAKAE